MKNKNYFQSIFESPTSSLALLLVSLGNRGGQKKWVEIRSSGTLRARKKFSQDIARLKSRKIIEIKEKDAKLMARLSKKGFIEFLKLKLTDAEELPDGLVCLVVFDIPEKTREIRKLFRKFLRGNYFLFTQKSVWVSHFNVAPILNELLVFFNLKKWVKIYLGQEIISSTWARSGVTLKKSGLSIF
jgi:hypothetical protein